MLGHALDHRAWSDALGIVQALDQYWDTRGLGAESAAWADRIIDAIPDPSQAPSDLALALSLYTTIHQANRQKSAGLLEQAAHTYRRILTYLHDQPATDWARRNIAVICHQLGMTAQDRGRLGEAEGWYRQSLTIQEEFGNRPGMAGTYHQLGVTAQLRKRLDEAEGWYRRSLAMQEELGRLPGLALTYAQLGLLAEARQQPRQALGWVVRCVTFFDEFPSPLTGTGPSDLIRLGRQLGMATLEETWRQVTGQPLHRA